MTAPLLKWPGGKRKLAGRIAEELGACPGDYFEPFLGAGAVALHMASEDLVGGQLFLSDCNERLMAVHRAVKLLPQVVFSELHKLPSGERFKDHYLSIRGDTKAPRPHSYNGNVEHGLINGPAQAARFVWLNKCGFNGLWRENKKGFNNVPVGRYKRPSLPTRQHILDTSALLRNTVLLAEHFSSALEAAEEGDCVYCDPPYVPRTETASFTAYTAGGFPWSEQVALAEAATVAADRGVRVVLSNHDLPVVHGLYEPRGFHLTSLSVRRSISRDGATRNSVGELLISKGPKR